MSSLSWIVDNANPGGHNKIQSACCYYNFGA